MTDNRLGGIALIIGALSGGVTMAVHPVLPNRAITPAEVENLATAAVWGHALAIAGIPFLFLGALGLTKRLDSPGRFAIAALAMYSMSLVAVMIAPALSGLVGPEILRKIMAAGPTSEQWRVLLSYNYMLNQAFDRIFVLASGAGIGLWSVQIVSRRVLPRVLGCYGLGLALAILAAVASGMRMNAHGFGLIIFGEGIWFVLAGVFLIRGGEALYADSPA
jgi:hypothetical protein